jgi:phosphoribosylformylglycinamidine synthase
LLNSQLSILNSRLSSLNAASKEWVIRQYDHEVQGGSVIKPLVGPGEGPSDGAVIRPRLDSRRGVAIANGICPELSDVDPYWMAVAAIDEALRNIVCVGGDPAHTAILDNFCWGNCENPQTMGALVRACQACYDAAVTYGTPFISGKDSLNNEFSLDAQDVRRLAGKIPLHNNRIRIPETLLVSAISVLDDVARCVTMDAKRVEGSKFLYVGLSADSWPEVKIAEAAALHRFVSEQIAGGYVLAAHDCGSDGMLPALAEMAVAGRCGVDVTVPAERLFALVTSGYILQVAPAHCDALQSQAGKLAGVRVDGVGAARSDEKLVIGAAELPVSELSIAWRSTLNW